ncbi:hypothetical protein FALBO_2978 [Fusarium albosuccineum]|uniref:2EXR domain-containing protein n=1 Tax=Fusarium albosuccineum TaxID=1237068 RepID=A0A8H4LJ75_9HYPO|nr:hypothetical protein FALBO_2978 [Fusarium albosuccineum]
MPASFHLFSRLPSELRNMIWQSAIRPKRFRAHFFQVAQMIPSWRVRLHPHQGIPRPSRGIASPAIPSAPCWTLSESSVCLIDGGLWTACKESRRVMEKEFTDDYWDQTGEVGPPGKEGYFGAWLLDNEASTPETCRFTGLNGRGRYVTMFPSQDLFILQLDSLDSLGVAHFGSMSLAWPDGPRNMALEYGPNWEAVMRHTDIDTIRQLEPVKAIVQAVLESPSVWNTWLIDMSVKRKPDEAAMPVPNSSDRWVFYAIDRRFVETPDDDTEFEAEFESMGGAGSRLFARALRLALNASIQEMQDPLRVDPEQFEFGVLCEYI